MPFSFKPPEGQAPQVDIFSKDAITSRIKESGGSILLFFCVTAFVASLLIAGGLYAYQQKLAGEVREKKAKLAEYDSKIGILPIEEMRFISTRIKYGSKLIDDHVSVNTAFRILEDSVENPVTFTKFDLQTNSSNGGYDLGLGGKAPDYKSVIQQQETFKIKRYSKYLSNPVFSGVGTDEKGTVNFIVKSPIIIKGQIPEEMIIQKDDTTDVQPVKQDVAPQTVATTTKPSTP